LIFTPANEDNFDTFWLLGMRRGRQKKAESKQANKLTSVVHGFILTGVRVWRIDPVLRSRNDSPAARFSLVFIASRQFDEIKTFAYAAHF
jgi:hypothetical protein